jgi:long-chain acyl-CoA synthetase
MTPALVGADTLPKLLLDRAARPGGRPAMREKEYGIWQTYTWRDYAARVRDFALGLRELGFGRGATLAVVGDNRPQLYWAEAAAQALGGIPVPLYQDAIAAEMHYVLEHAGCAVVVAEDQEQVDKILELRDKLPALRHIVFDDPKGMRHYAEPGLVAFAAVEERGRAAGEAGRRAFAEEVAAGRGEDIALINYTSGTTGLPKGVMLSHRAFIDTARAFLAVEPLDDRDELMAYLPMAWIGDSFFSLAVAFVAGCAVNCPEDTTTVRSDFREIGPTMTFAPPRIWESFVSQSQVRIADAAWLQRHLVRFFLPRGMRLAKLELEGKSAPWRLRLLAALGRLIVFAPLRDQLGLRRLRAGITGGAALGPEVIQFFRTLGVNFKQLYGMTECCAPATLHRGRRVKLETVGEPLPGVTVRIAESGEVLLRSPGCFSGYFKNEEATRATLDAGWIRSGDAGLIDPEGHLVIIDRATDVSRLLDGSVFAPQYVENKLKFSPYIKEAVAIGHERPFVGALVNIDLEVVGNWAERRGVAYAGYADLTQNPAVGDLIATEVRRTNETLAPSQRVRRFLLLHKELDADDAEITRTRKLRRKVIHERYAPLIAAVYDAAATTVPVKVTVTYEDGRTSETERTIAIRDLPVEDGAPVGAAAARPRGPGA